MRYSFGLVCVLALGVIGCSETAGRGGSGGSAGGGETGGDGGSAGSGGTSGIGGHGGTGGTAGFGGDGGSGGIGGAAGAGGDAGTGGAPDCQGNEDCDDGNECTEDTCTDRRCNNTAAEDGTACTNGECLGGVCAPVGAFPCTEQGIRGAIAVGGGPHFFACDGGTPVVTDWEITIDKDVILDGEGRLIVDGSEDHRAFYIPVGVTAELQGIKVIQGATQDNGGGIRNGGTLTLINSAVSQSTALCDGSCLYQGFGGGIYNDNFATLTMVNSTVSNNIAREWGGGIFNSGTMTLTNSTVSGNTAKNGSGICGFDVTLTNSTVSGNTSTNGSDICAGTVTLTNSLVDGDCEGILPLTSNGYNIESPGDTCGFDQATDLTEQTVEELNLGPLQNNDGLTETHALGLLPTPSVAIDRIPEADCEVTTDQRGLSRPVAILGSEPKCDVGSFEVQPAP